MHYIFKTEPDLIRCAAHVTIYRRQRGIVFRCHKHGTRIFSARWNGRGNYEKWFDGLLAQHKDTFAMTGEQFVCEGCLRARRRRKLFRLPPTYLPGDDLPPRGEQPMHCGPC